MIQGCANFLIHHTVIVMLFTGVMGLSLIFWHMQQLSKRQIETTAFDNAQIYTDALTEFRSLYTSEVVVPATAMGIEVSHDYKMKEGAIPLPATLSMLLGNRIGGNSSGVKSRLYSDYPFPWRDTSGGLTDNFSRSAWEALRNDPEKPFTRFEEVDGRMSLRYATADLMRTACVDCHNTHPDTPKNDWKAGDVRGVLEVITPIESHLLLFNDMLKQTLALLSVALLLSITCVGAVMRALHLRTNDALASAQEVDLSNQKLIEEVEERKQAQAKLKHLSQHDGLTGLHNRRYFDEQLEAEWKRAIRQQYEIAIIMIDIDYFKNYNDLYGHQAGDDCLRVIANTIRKSVTRESDTLARYGGEEFVVILPGTAHAGVIKIAEKMRVNVEALQLENTNALPRKIVTISMGVASSQPTIDDKADQLLKMADNRLYDAKSGGRNRLKSCVNSQITLVRS